MLSMDVNHPDILEFVKVKRDLTQVTGANISVKLNKEFMDAVKNDQDYILSFPCNNKFEQIIDTSKLPYDVLTEVDYGEVGCDTIPGYCCKGYVKRIRAKKLWDEIIKSAHNVAEPGLMFWDTMTEYSPDGVYPEYKQVTTNPCCFAESCRVDVITDKGVKDIREITENDLVWIQNEAKFVPTKGYTNYGKAETYEIKFSNGDGFIVTDNHKFAKVVSKRIGTKTNKDNFELVELKDLKVGDEIRVHNEESLSFGNKGTKEEGYILGWLTGDGCLSYANEGDSFPTMYLDFWKKEHDTADKIVSIVNELGLNNTLLQFKNNGNDVRRIASARLTRYFTEKYEHNIWRFKNGRNSFLYEASKEFVQGYLSAYFTADGTVQNVVESSRYAVQLSSIDLERLKQVQTLLLNFGIKSSIGLSRKAGDSNDYSFDNTKDCYRLTINGVSNIKRFKKHIGFINEQKQNKLDSICETELCFEKSVAYTKIVSIEYHGVEEVGCIEVPEYHYFTANTIISGNSEIAMQPYDACRLIAVNLFSFVVNPFTEDAYFDFDKFYKINYESMRLSDDLVDLELEQIDRILAKVQSDPESEDVKRNELELWTKIKETASSSRRTGLGFTGLADTLAALGMKYDADKALEEVEKIMQTKMASEFDCTIDLAVLRGTFKGWNKDAEYSDKAGNNPFYEFFDKKFPTIAERMKKYGRRNVSVSTLAPTGTVSMMTATSSGVEPLFQPFYIRRKKVNPSDKESRVDFVDQNGDSWQEYPIMHPKFKLWVDMKGKDTETLKEAELQELFEQSPWFGSTANDIDWVKRVQIQSVIQKYITHSISSTINLPSDVSEEEVSKIYLKSYEHNLKGVTVYRDGSRSGVMITKSENKDRDSFEYVDAVKRPKVIDSEVHETTVAGTKYFVVVGLLDGKPYEVFISSDQLTKGKAKTVKYSKGVYKLEQNGIETVISTTMTDEQGAITRLVSTSLRHGADIKFIVEQLLKTEGYVFSFTKGLARVLKKYIANGEKASVTCHKCGSTEVVFEEGCMSCKSCGDSKCG